MPHRLRKIRRQRGSRTHGWGQVGQHRGIGMRGGHGKAGKQKHKWTYVVKYQPNYFGKHGFKRSWITEIETMNVGELDERIEMLLEKGFAEMTGEEFTIDLQDLGVKKLLGSGKVTHVLRVRAEAWSPVAAEKIQKAGGQIIAKDTSLK